MRKILSAVFALSLLFPCLFSCAGATKVKYQELPADKPLAVKINDVVFRVVSFGTTKDWSELEIAVANETGEEIEFDPSKVYLTNEKGYDLVPLTAGEVNERVRRKTGKFVSPLSVGTIAAAVGYIILPSSKDRATAGRAAVALGAGALTQELAKRQATERDIERKEDLLIKSYKIPPKLQVGGVLYFRATEGMKGAKAFIKVRGAEEFFQVEF